MSAIIKALESALGADPSNWETRHALIEAYLAESRDEDAHALLHEIESLPEEEGALISAGLCYSLVGSTEDGRRIIGHVLEHQPGNAKAHLAMASVAHQEGDSRAAMRHYLTATGIDSNLSSPELEEAYGGVLDQAAAGETAETASTEEEQSSPEASATATAIPVEAIEEEEAVEAVTVVPESSESTAEPDAADVVAKVRPLRPTVVEEEKAPAEKEASTVPLIEAQPPQPDLSPMTESAKSESVTQSNQVAPTVMDKPKLETTGQAHLAGDEAFDHDFDGHDISSDDIRHWKEEAENEKKRAAAREKIASLTITILLHVGVFVLLGLVIIAVPRDVPPQLVAAAVADAPEDQIQTQTVQKTQVKQSSAASATPDMISVESFSPVAISNVEAPDLGTSLALTQTDFQPSMTFGSAPSSMESKMMFGQKVDGKVLGVILDVSGSMAEYLPMVVAEVDRNFKNAPIVYVNHAGMLGDGKDSEMLPIVEEEVIPYWNDETGRRHHSPYWFLWHDLPRKAEQRYVDRLIETFKKRPNMFIVRGGRNRVGAAADFLMTQGIDALYVFSDFEDFVDEEVSTELGQRLSRKKIKGYIQPAAAKTEHLAVMSRRVAGRSQGRELPALTDLLRPGDDGLEPIGVAAKPEPTPVPDGVSFATPRAEITGPLVHHFHWWSGHQHKEIYKDVLKVVEYPNFDLVIRGPAARAYIYLKTDDGYIQNPIVFGFHSRKPYVSEKDGKTYYRWRKWLRNVEEPKMDGDEFIWNMVLEDDIRFDVRFSFKPDTLTGTYRAEFPPEEEYDYAHVYFVVPPMAREKEDTYLGLDFPDGLSLEDLRLAMTDNVATFYLPAQAEDRHGAAWSRLGFKRGENRLPYNILYRDLPSAVREVTVSGPSFGPRKLEARTTSNSLLLDTGNRADMELWEGFLCRLVRPDDRREGFRKTEAIAFSIE